MIFTRGIDYGKDRGRRGWQIVSNQSSRIRLRYLAVPVHLPSTFQGASVVGPARNPQDRNLVGDAVAASWDLDFAGTRS
jgi:hypothetical protein